MNKADSPNTHKLAEVLRDGRSLKKGDQIRLTLDLSHASRPNSAEEGSPPSAPLFRGDKRKGRLSLELNGVKLGQLASGIEVNPPGQGSGGGGGRSRGAAAAAGGGGLCWMAELCGGEAVRVK